MVKFYGVLGLTLFLGFAVLNAYVLKYFLKIPFKTALLRYLTMAFLGGIVIIEYPDFFLTYPTMDSLFSISGASAIWHEVLSTGQLMWALLFFVMRMALFYVWFYLLCYIYEHHIDASVDKSRLKKAILLITVLGLVFGWVMNLGFMLFVK